MGQSPSSEKRKKALDDADYRLFRSTVAQQKACFGMDETKIWKYFDFGPHEATPLVCLHSTAGTADCFYRQFNELVGRGVRLVAVQFPAYSTHDEWIQGFDELLDHLHITKCHLLGASLGGFLAMLYARFHGSRLGSLFLVNSFYDNATLRAPLDQFDFSASFLLKRSILKNFATGNLEERIADSVDFMVDMIDSLSREEVASRLKLNCGEAYVGTPQVPEENITILETLDYNAVPEGLRAQLRERFPGAKVVYMKTGGDFPYLARPDEVNMNIMVHLRRVDEYYRGRTVAASSVAASSAASVPSTIAPAPAPATAPAPAAPVFVPAAAVAETAAPAPGSPTSPPPIPSTAVGDVESSAELPPAAPAAHVEEPSAPSPTAEPSAGAD
ncbi:putative Alpha/beta-Hydrolases superfamily protein [Paratrimastix pyriformis]|uniref:Maspardin n=1 Tax=Paratrimastix pyriformis TaxID=342808 RepID=A0ABQ8UPT6_9EUKA|nr:putative Alpha/beta-Hydrolases superfamily protein [Paratrimastix pyriformis]|eukprot:GAFH01002303.1.p1 GENE.GAFH01002303.1~~GAFH01002303.1.p1  ORF type:complete len:387 (+),score=43.65 GAFH01002303.1:51-1211(+)